MNAVKMILVSFLAVLSLSFAGCQGNNSDGGGGVGVIVGNGGETTIPNSETPVIKISDSSITITQDAETLQVQILAFDKNDQSLNEGTIVVRYPTEITRQNVNGGRFLENEVQITNGEALFTFVGPIILENLGDLIFRFNYKEDTLVTPKDLIVSYKPPVATVVLTSATKEVKLNSETVGIDISVLDENNNPFPTGIVKVIYPDDVLSGRDVGVFISSAVPLVNGIASFVYTAPKNLKDDESDIVFKFYHDSLPNITQTFTVKIKPDPAQIELIDYTLSASLTDGNLTMGLQSSKLITLFIKEKDGPLISDTDVITIDVEVLNKQLVDLQNTDGVIADKITLLKNSSSLNIKSGTISGLVPISVIATFKDANNITQELTKVFNIVIASGPPTAMSISYAGTTNDNANSKFVEKMIVALTDKYSNRVNNSPGFSVGLIAGYASDSSGPLGYMYHTSGAKIDIVDSKVKVDAGNVVNVTLTNRGKNYLQAPTVSLAGGNGEFSAIAELSNLGSISEIKIVNPGSTYTAAPSVTALGTGTGFNAQAVLFPTGSFFTNTVSLTTSNKILTLDDPGSGYLSSPTVSALGGSNFDAVAVLEAKGSIRFFTISAGGSGYAVGDELPVSGDGTGAVAKVEAVSGGGITSVRIINAGIGYTSASVDTFTAGNKDAIVTATIGFGVKEVQLRNGGSGYSNDAITISGGSPLVNAKVSATIGYGLASISILSAGQGYKNATVKIGDGLDATGLVLVKYPVSRIRILNGGEGYANGAALTFTSKLGDTGTGVAANATTFAGFSKYDENNQFLMTFGNGFSYDASGKWDATRVGTNNNFELVLKDEFNGETTSNLGFAIGNNNRQDSCLAGREWVAEASTPKSAEFDSNGLAEISISYDYYLVAKDIALSVNLVGEQNSLGRSVKVGESIKHTLRGTGISAKTVNLPEGLSFEIIKMLINIDDTAEPLRNANFVFSVAASLGVTVHSVSTSRDNGISNCGPDEEGRAFVEVVVSTSLPGTVALENLVISGEF